MQTSATVTPQNNTAEEAHRQAKAWCIRRPSWATIASLESGVCENLYVQWTELSPQEQEGWGSEDSYNEFGTKKCKVKFGFITGDGVFHKDIRSILPGMRNIMTVYQIGTAAVAANNARIARYESALGGWLAANPDWVLSRDVTRAGREKLYIQWEELSEQQQSVWTNAPPVSLTPKERYGNSGTQKLKVPAGYLCEAGFFNHYRDLPVLAESNLDYQVVFKVGPDHSSYVEPKAVDVPVSKALSIQQPWAWLIAHGYKDVENRTWTTKHRGEFYIHAGKKIDMNGYRWVTENFPDIPLPAPAEFELGGIVGKVNLLDCREPAEFMLGSVTGKGELPQSPARSPWHFDDCVAFMLGNAQVLPFRALKGQLNFFKVAPTLPAESCEQ